MPDFDNYAALFINQKTFTMRKYSNQVLSLLLIASLFSCTKKSSVPINPGLSESWPQNWVLTIDFNADTYKYLHIVGIIINRNEVEKSYSMTELAKEKECNWQVKQEGQVNGRTAYSFHLEKNKNYRWMVSKTATVMGTEQWYLGTHYSATPPSENYWKFYLHFFEKQNGNKVVAIESVAKPGYYLNNSGHTLAANGVALVHYDDPEKATRFEAH
jgi:hypothetical protein